MTRRNDTPFSLRPAKPAALFSRVRFMRLGYLLGGTGMLSATIAQAQTVVPSSVVIPNGATVEQALEAAPDMVPGKTSTRAADLQPPERVLEVESVDQTMAMPAADTPVLAVPEVATEVAPRQAEAVPEVVSSDPAPKPSPTAAQPSPSPSSQKPTTATKLPPTKAPAQQSQVSKQPPKINLPVPAEVPVAAVPEAPAEPAPEPAPALRLGPISISSAGISVSPTAIQPYFNPKLAMSKLPGLPNLSMMFPVAIPAPITSLFGWRIHPISGSQRMHTGTDIGAPMGTPVLAAMPGRVMLADDMGGYGLTVALEHDNGMRQTLYAHMSELFVRPGDIVQQGTVIGRVGSTGASTGAHLHFELRQMLPDGTWVAQDAGQHLEFSMANLMRSLQVAQQPQAKSVAQRPQQQTVMPQVQQSEYPSVKFGR
jgi:murein DD-endopeptidase MepM/ murein hydrolase activator NlpD